MTPKDGSVVSPCARRLVAASARCLRSGVAMDGARVVPNHERRGERTHERHGEDGSRPRLDRANAIDGGDPALPRNSPTRRPGRGFIGRGFAGGAGGVDAEGSVGSRRQKLMGESPASGGALGGIPCPTPGVPPSR